MQVTWSFQQALTSTLTFAQAFTFQERATTMIGVPILGKVGIDFTATQAFTTTTTNTQTQTSTITYALQQQIPALTAQSVTARASAGILTVRVRRQAPCLSACLLPGSSGAARTL